jgi:glycosyltransferase involved in cell wall biosynthesis
MGDRFREAAHVLAAYKALAGTDIIHDHTELGPLLAGRRGTARQPLVTTIHGPVTPRNHRTLAEAARHASIVAISRAHARSFGDIPVTAVIHHGIDLDIHTPGPGNGGYLLFTGRMSPDKGVHHAVRVARQAGWPLVMSAKIRAPAERAYFNQQVRPLLGPDDEMLPEQPLAARVELMRRAAALLNPITWPEPFGLVMAEALATATPVLAFPNGAAPEIIDHGQTGYLCRGEDEMTAAVARVGEIDRWQCRAAAEQRFSLARMAADYERLYRAILEHPGQVTNGRTATGAL